MAVVGVRWYPGGLGKMESALGTIVFGETIDDLYWLSDTSVVFFFLIEW